MGFSLTDKYPLELYSDQSIFILKVYFLMLLKLPAATKIYK